LSWVLHCPSAYLAWLVCVQIRNWSGDHKGSPAALRAPSVELISSRKRLAVLWTWGRPMSTTVIASLLVGAVLALRFKVSILVPTILAAWAVLMGIGLAWEITAAWITLEIAVVTTALQVGYLSALLLEGLAIPPS